MKCASAGDQPARLLQPDAVVAVDHDLGDVRVAQERLDRSVAQDVVADLLGDPGPVAAAQRPVLRAEHVGEDLADLGVELVLVHVGVVEMRTHLLQQLDVDAALELLDPVRSSWCSTKPRQVHRRLPERCASSSRRRRQPAAARTSALVVSGRRWPVAPCAAGRRGACRRPRWRRDGGLDGGDRRGLATSGRPPGLASSCSAGRALGLVLGHSPRAAASRSARFMAYLRLLERRPLASASLCGVLGRRLAPRRRDADHLAGQVGWPARARPR